MQEQADLDKFEERLWRPPPGVAVTQGPWSPEAETKAFSALSQQIKGPEQLPAGRAGRPTRGNVGPRTGAGATMRSGNPPAGS